MPRILAIASGGGHWIQLRRLAPAFQGLETLWVSVGSASADEVRPERYRAVPDATRWNPLRLVQLALTVLWILLRERPEVIVTTGAAPGFFALVFGKGLGARTVWIDSIANVDELSGSGARIGRFADLWLTQWPQLARSDGPRCGGAVL